MGKNGIEDNEIIKLFFERSEEAVAQLSKRYGSLCKSMAENILKNKSDAEECVNDAYLAVWNTVPPQAPCPLVSYLCRILRNIAVKKYRSNTAKKRNSFYDFALEDLADCIPSASSVEEECGAKELSEAINSYLDSIDRESRIIFVRRYFYCDSIESISKLTGIGKHNLSVRLSRIKEKLKIHLAKEGIYL